MSREQVSLQRAVVVVAAAASGTHCGCRRPARCGGAIRWSPDFRQMLLLLARFKLIQLTYGGMIGELISRLRIVVVMIAARSRCIALLLLMVL